ncbi:hypothetical protein PtA15_11A598 [Puccinia triticina]|uniref:non-specific serine/threonine protein kinase n=1 Tax=Puccinia triticina TaxID=208348 RepID=A0ABY7D0L9_9BASI|nr:uncharacterized protein PtA15_11A598 [Puccinia triticina]WAQ89906.1 hypothetical protein PtA15_11A598 [Puccinia triticina]WAR59952.1 hypothetical protein PtB15_11B593 [Puccinia triticina]
MTMSQPAERRPSLDPLQPGPASLHAEPAPGGAAVSRASSARSTSSVQAVPLRIPARLSPLLTTAGNQPTRPALPRTHSTPKRINDFIGSYSTVYHVTDKQPPNKQFALKVLDKRHIQKEKKTKYVAIERDTLNLLDRHPGCIRLYSTFQDEASLYYLLEYAPKGEILRSIKTLGSFSTDCARFYAAQILSAIQHMHSRGVIHRDIKPENILLDAEMRIKIADFGSAKILNTAANEQDAGERSHSFVGTAEYVSPELLVQKTTSKSSDLWAFGCVLFQMIAGLPPFRSRSEYLTFQKITHLEYEFPAGFPTEAQDLVARLLVLEPERRIGASPEHGGIEEIKAHPFFAPLDWHRLWEQDPPTLQPGLLLAAPARPPDDQPSPSAAGPVYLPEFFLPPPPSPPMLPVPDPSSLQYPPPVDPAHHTDDDDEPPPEPKPSSLGNALSKRKSWLLGAGRRKSKEDAYVCTSSGEMTWVEVYLPNELVIYSSVVNELWSPSGTSSSSSTGKTPASLTREMVVGSLRGKRKKKRQLILTDFPRLLCVKEEPKSSKIRVKFEVLFKPLPSPDTSDPSPAPPPPPPTTTSSSSSARAVPGADFEHSKTPSNASSSDNHSASSKATNSTAVLRHPHNPNPTSGQDSPSSPVSSQFQLFKSVVFEDSRCFRLETVPTSDLTTPEGASGPAGGRRPVLVRRFEDKAEAAQRWTDEINLAFRVANQLGPLPPPHTHT